MVMKSLLAKVGIGAATVDTVIENPRLCPGEILRGIIVAKGGNAVQEVDGITLHLESVAELEQDGHQEQVGVTLLVAPLGERFALQPGESKSIPFSLRIPYECPINLLNGDRLHRVPLTIRTSLDIKGAIDPKDRDPIWVEPNAVQQSVLDAFDRLGLRFKGADLEYGRAGTSTLPCYQELEFYAGLEFPRVNEVELTFIGKERHLDLIIETDRKRRGMAAFLAGGSFDDIRALRLEYDSHQTLDIASHIYRLLNY